MMGGIVSHCGGGYWALGGCGDGDWKEGGEKREADEAKE